MVISHFHGFPAERVPKPSPLQRGETLVEVMVTIVLMGAGFASIFGGIFVVAKVTRANLRDTQASNGVQAWAEGLQQPATALSDPPVATDFTYKICATPGSYGRLQLPQGIIPSGWRGVSDVTKVELLDGFVGGVPQWGRTVGNCYGAGGDLGIQRITVKIQSNDNPKVEDTLVVIKRDQRCPSTFDNADLGPC